MLSEAFKGWDCECKGVLVLVLGIKLRRFTETWVI